MRKESEIDGGLSDFLHREWLVAVELISRHIDVFQCGIKAHRLAVFHQCILIAVQRQDGRQQHLERLKVKVDLITDFWVGHDCSLSPAEYSKRRIVDYPVRRATSTSRPAVERLATGPQHFPASSARAALTCSTKGFACRALSSATPRRSISVSLASGPYRRKA